MLINNNFTQLPETYLFTKIARKVANYREEHPQADIISLGIGDVTRPIAPTVIKALHRSVDEMAVSATFHGYGPEQGYEFLRKTIAKNDFAHRGINISPDEIFISDGAKSDTGNIGDILDKNNRVAVTDPVYPVYLDSNVMAGRAGTLQSNGKWSNLIYIPCTAENGFVPELPSERPDIIYLCYPNNPTGIALRKSELQKWVEYALENDVLIMFDAAYEAFIHNADVPHSIYEIPDAKKIAIEFRSFSKTAGFTGLRCGYTIVPKAVRGRTANGERIELNKLWNRRQCTKFNGTAYIVQRAAEAIYTPEGQKEIRADIDYYMHNATTICNGLTEAGLQIFGGTDAPYIWLKTPAQIRSWSFFDFLLNECQVIGTPGVGFGPCGEGYFRLTAFSDQNRTLEAVRRIKEKLKR